MTELTIHDAALADVKDKVVVLTGGASGIGHATAKFLLEQGALVVAGDIKEPLDAFSSHHFTFVQTDVTSWHDLKRLFKTAVSKYGRVDHAFANAGIAPRAAFTTDDADEESDEPRQPDHAVVKVNYIAVLETVKLALHYIRRNPSGGSIVMTASSSSYQRFTPVEYTSSKHAVLGILRGLHGQLHPKLPVRLNAICPSWTETGLVDAATCARAGLRSQPPLAVARCVALLMADASRNSQLLYSCQGRYTEFEAELLAAADGILDRAASRDPRTRSEAAEMEAFVAARREMAREQQDATST